MYDTDEEWAKRCDAELERQHNVYEVVGLEELHMQTIATITAHLALHHTLGGDKGVEIIGQYFHDLIDFTIDTFENEK